jgi:Domain of unknown function (DUF4331)
MSNHFSAANLTFPGGDARLDLTDVYAFLAPNDPDRTVLVMDVNTFKIGTEFHPDAVYRMNVDVDGDARTDMALSAIFSQPTEGQQTATIYVAKGELSRQAEPAGEILVSDMPVSFSAEPQIIDAPPYRLFVGVRSDPFFMDIEGVLHGFQWTGQDTFEGKNVFSIVIEAPNEVFGADPTIGVWAQTLLRRDGEVVHIDRGGHPLLTGFFNPEEAKEQYRQREPADDRDNYLEPWSQVLQQQGGYSTDEARAALGALLPDILRYDRSRPAAYPNGRTLTDDVADARLAFVTNGKVLGDNIGPHTDLLAEFPYLGAPHPTPDAS